MRLQRLRNYVVNAFIAAIIVVVIIDTLPQSPTALRLAVAPWLGRVGLDQGVWNLYAPDPDHTNTRLRAEITYRDGERREWHGPDWNRVSAWQKWVGHRHVEWLDHVIFQHNAPALEPWCREIARTARPELSAGDRGAEVRVIYSEAVIPSAEIRPWPKRSEPPKFDDGWVLTIEKLP